MIKELITTNKPTIITVSGKARHGKDTFSNLLKDKLTQKGKRVLRIAYAEYMKYIATQYLGWDGRKNEAGRTLLQQLGTEKVRSKQPDFWVDNVIRLVNVLRSDFDYVIVSDCRYPNEIERWKDEGYEVIPVHVDRPGFESELTEEQKNHISETALDGHEFDFMCTAEDKEQLNSNADFVSALI